MKLTKEQLDNRRNDPNWTDVPDQQDFIDTIDDLEKEIAAIQAKFAAAMEKAVNEIQEHVEGLHGSDQSQWETGYFDGLHRAQVAIRALIPSNWSAAFEERVRQAKLDELKTIAYRGLHADKELDSYVDNRMAELRAAAGAEEGKQ